MDEAERLRDRIAVVDHGKAIACTPTELIARLGVSTSPNSLDDPRPIEMRSLEELQAVTAVRQEDESFILTAQRRM